MKRKLFFIAVALTVGASLLMLSSCEKDKDNSAITMDEWRVVHISTTYSGEYPFPSAAGYDYDGLARISVKHDTTNLGTDYQEAGDITFTYSDNLIVCNAVGAEYRYTLANGRVTNEEEKYTQSGTTYRSTTEYDADNHLVKEICSNGDTTIYTWQGDDLVSLYVHYTSRGIKLRETYTMSEYPYSALPFSDAYTGRRELSVMGYFGKQSAHLPVKVVGVITDSDGDVEYTRNYTYLLNDGRVQQVNVEEEGGFPYTINVKWDKR